MLKSSLKAPEKHGLTQVVRKTIMRFTEPEPHLIDICGEPSLIATPIKDEHLDWQRARASAWHFGAQDGHIRSALITPIQAAERARGECPSLKGRR
mmetsp:Transcript_6561/g.17605  ORF Transcript_6561/g.17605 Transcript_6561/m.17605 type:complete len:96 (-) Transcript_6561:1048-1335(-)